MLTHSNNRLYSIYTTVSDSIIIAPIQSVFFSTFFSFLSSKTGLLFYNIYRLSGPFVRASSVRAIVRAIEMSGPFVRATGVL